MSTFRRFCTATKRTARKITDKAEQLVDSATVSVKVKTLEMKIEEKYEDLGRLIYRDLHTDDNLEEEKLQIIAEIDALFDRVAALKDGLDENDTEEAQEAEESAEAPEAEAAEQAPASDAE